jgi:hypothetical protein
MMRRASVVCLLALVAAVPRAVAGQCGIDLVQSGIEAYRDLNLALATELLTSATELSEQSSSACASERARALTYLGATHWLSDRPDSARLSFQRAVIETPRHRPDAVEFPPEITDLFDDVRRATPSVALTVPREVEITRDGETIGIRLTASTSHPVTVEVHSAQGEPMRTLYRGSIDPGAQGTLVAWDGRGADGDVVASGDYQVEAISSSVSPDGTATPVRKVVLALSVQATPVVEPRLPLPEPRDGEAAVAVDDRGPSTWRAVGTVAAGLLGGAAVVAIPHLVDGGSGQPARFAVAGAFGVAGIVGLVQRLRGGGSGDPPARPPLLDPVDAVLPGSASVETPVRWRLLRIRAGSQWRVELDGGLDERPAPGAPPGADLLGGGR